MASYDDDRCGPSVGPSARLNGECRVPVRRHCPPAYTTAAPRRYAACPPARYGAEVPAVGAEAAAAIGAEAHDSNEDYAGPEISPQREDWDCSEGFDIDKKENHVNRRFLIEFRFSLQEAAQNPEVTKWRVDSSFFSIFQRRPHDSQPGDMRREGDLSKVIIVAASVTEVRSDVQTSILVRPESMRGNAYTQSGGRAPLWITPNTQRIFEEPVKIFVPDESVKNLTVKNFSATSRADVEDANIVLGKTGFTYVPIDSPIVLVLEHNHENVGFFIYDMPVVDERYYKLRNDIVASCCDTLDRRVFQTLPFCNLSTWTISLARADGLCWDDPTNIACMAENDEIATYFLEKKNYVAIGLYLTYVICDKNVSKTGSAQAKAEGAAGAAASA